MGRHYGSRKITVEECYSLRIFKGMLTGQVKAIISWQNSKASIGLTVNTATEKPFARLFYTATDGNCQRDYDYTVPLETIPCYFGGARYYFTCPECSRRVGVLYLAPGEVYFRCRHCQDLSYQSRNCSVERKYGIATGEIRRLRGEVRRLTWRGSFTRKVRRIQALERKREKLSATIVEKLRKFQVG